MVVVVGFGIVGLARVGECLDMINGRAFKPTDWQSQGLPIVRIQNLNNSSAPFNYCESANVDRRHVIEDGCFLISWSGTPGTSFGAFIWDRGRAALNQHIFKCIQVGGAFDDQFLRIAINGRLDEMIAKAHGGVGLQHITKGKLENLVLSLPPLVEQHRIVAKVDELMALCDRLEAAQAERESRRDRLVSASLHRLNQPAEDATAFRDDARFVLDHLARFTTGPEHIPQLRQTVLNLAASGKLTASWRKLHPGMADASEIVARLESVHSMAGGHKKGNAAAATDEAHDLRATDLPASWSITNLRTAVLPDRPITYGILMPGPDTPGGIPYVRVADFPNDRLVLSTIRRTTPEIETKYARARLRTGDILLSIRGTVGRVCVAPSELMNANITQDTARLSLQAPLLRDFVVWFLRSPAAQERMRNCAKGVAVRGINIGDVRALQLPVPPLDEQHQIVAAIRDLFFLCDRLEAQLTTTQTEGRRLLEAVLHEALSG